MYRYSLPVNFQAVIMKPHRKSQKKLTEILNGLYGHLDSNYIASEAEVLIRKVCMFLIIITFFRCLTCKDSLLGSKTTILMCSSR